MCIEIRKRRGREKSRATARCHSLYETRPRMRSAAVVSESTGCEIYSARLGEVAVKLWGRGRRSRGWCMCACSLFCILIPTVSMTFGRLIAPLHSQLSQWSHSLIFPNWSMSSVPAERILDFLPSFTLLYPYRYSINFIFNIPIFYRYHFVLLCDWREKNTWRCRSKPHRTQGFPRYLNDYPDNGFPSKRNLSDLRKLISKAPIILVRFITLKQSNMPNFICNFAGANSCLLPSFCWIDWWNSSQW